MSTILTCTTTTTYSNVLGKNMATTTNMATNINHNLITVDIVN